MIMQNSVAAEISKDSDNDINLTPMLDVVFIMLIFFIVTASFIKETGLDVSPPDASQDKPVDTISVLIAIDDTNRIWIDGRLIDPRAVRANIERRRAENPDAGVVIQTEKRSSNKTLVQVMDASRAAGVDDFSLAKGPSYDE
jgi:biopolymer transport protein ExbD